MNKLEELEDECYAHHINLIDANIDDLTGAFINYKSTNIIALKSNLDANARTCVLCEELGHFYKDATYNINCKDLNYISKQEHKAKGYAYERLVPYDELVEFKNQNLYEIAEHFDVTPMFLKDAISYYVSKYG